MHNGTKAFMPKPLPLAKTLPDGATSERFSTRQIAHIIIENCGDFLIFLGLICVGFRQIGERIYSMINRILVQM